jgi:hypothetical protein
MNLQLGDVERWINTFLTQENITVTAFQDHNAENISFPQAHMCPTRFSEQTKDIAFNVINRHVHNGKSVYFLREIISVVTIQKNTSFK